MNFPERKTPCPACKGTGTVCLGTAYNEETLRTLQVFPPRREVSVEWLWRELGEQVTINAVNNRLRKMLDNGLIKRRKKGRFFYYTKAP